MCVSPGRQKINYCYWLLLGNIREDFDFRGCLELQKIAALSEETVRRRLHRCRAAPQTNPYRGWPKASTRWPKPNIAVTRGNLSPARCCLLTSNCRVGGHTGTANQFPRANLAVSIGLPPTNQPDFPTKRRRPRFDLPSGVRATVHRQVCAGNVRGLRTGNERHQRSDLIHMPIAVERRNGLLRRRPIARGRI